MSKAVPVINQYHHDFAAKFGRVMDGHMREFARQIIAEGLDVDDVHRGILNIPRRAKSKPFSPNPIEFAELCKPSPADLGLPSFEDAYTEIDQCCRHASKSPKKYQHKHRMLELIMQDVGYNFRLASEEKRQVMLKKAYDKWLEVARTTGLPASVERIGNEIEPRPVCEQYSAKPAGGKLGQQIEQIRRNLQLRNQSKEKRCG